MSWYTDVSTWTRRPPVIQVYNDQGESFDYLPERTCAAIEHEAVREYSNKSGGEGRVLFHVHTFSCGHTFEWWSHKPPAHCPECGAKVVS